MDHARDGGQGEPLIVASFFEYRDAERCLEAISQHGYLRSALVSCLGVAEEARSLLFRSEQIDGRVHDPDAADEIARLDAIILEANQALGILPRPAAPASTPTPTAQRHADRMRRMASVVAGQVRKDPAKAMAANPRPQAAAASNAMQTAMVSGWDGSSAETLIDPRDAAPLPQASPFPPSLSTVRRDSAECPVAVLGQGDQERAILPSHLLPSQLLPNATSPQAHGRAAG